MNTGKQAVVSTKSGKLEGEYKDNIYVFKGIPYAAPPVGNLRWLPPRPPKPWSGVRPAKEYAAISPQNPMPIAAPGMPDFASMLQDISHVSSEGRTAELSRKLRYFLYFIFLYHYILYEIQTYQT
jgi:para-nitrobenzyl esterase